MIDNQPRMMTITEVAKTGLLPEHALRQMSKRGQLPAVYIGRKCFINYDLLVRWLNNLGGVNIE